MMIFIEYRKKGITSREHLLNCINPNSRNNGLRYFNVNSEHIGTENLEEVFKQSIIDVPGKEWELHKVYSIEPEQQIIRDYGI